MQHIKTRKSSIPSNKSRKSIGKHQKVCRQQQKHHHRTITTRSNFIHKTSSKSKMSSIDNSNTLQPTGELHQQSNELIHTATQVLKTWQDKMIDEKSVHNRKAESNHSLSDDVYSPEEIARLEEQLAETHKGTIMTPYFKSKLDQQAANLWNKFYKRNQDNFFKDRHYFHREIPELAQMSDEYSLWHIAYAKKAQGEILSAEEEERLINQTTPPNRPVLAEVGCGVGNTALCIYEDFEFDILGCDCSKEAIDIIKKSPLYDENRINVSVCDITKNTLPFADNSADIVTMVFTASALQPQDFPHVFSECFRILKPNGIFYIRDYAVYDLTMMRFKKGQRLSSEHYLFARGDGTRTFFFDKSNLFGWMQGAGFDVKLDDIKYVKKTVENIKEQKVMERRWIIGRATKTIPNDDNDEKTL